MFDISYTVVVSFAVNSILTFEDAIDSDVSERAKMAVDTAKTTIRKFYQEAAIACYRLSLHELHLVQTMMLTGRFTYMLIKPVDMEINNFSNNPRKDIWGTLTLAVVRKTEPFVTILLGLKTSLTLILKRGQGKYVR